LLRLASFSSHTNDFWRKNSTVYFINQIFGEEKLFFNIGLQNKPTDNVQLAEGMNNYVPKIEYFCTKLLPQR